MTYNPKIPKATASPKDSASPIQVNFNQYVSIFSRTAGGVIYNHIAFNDIHQGKHAAVLMDKVSNPPGVTQDLSVLFNKNAISNAGTQPQLFAQIPKFLPTKNDTTKADNAAMQLTYNQVNTAGPTQFQSFLIGKYLIYFGSSSSGVTVTLTPTPTKILMVQLQNSDGLAIQVTQPDKIKWQNGLFINPISWFVIGQA